MAGFTSADQTALIFLALIVLIMVRRTYLLSQGTPYSVARLFGYGAFSMALFGFLAASTIYVAWTVWGSIALALLAPYSAIVIATAWYVRPHVEKRVTFETRQNGVLYYRLPIVIPVLSLVFFVARLSVEIWILGLASITNFTVPTGVSTLDLVVLAVFDLLFGASIGLLIGRGLGVRRAYESRPKPTETPLTSSPESQA
jgi:hypothetical protein